MFVKVDRSGHTSIYQCERVHIRPHGENDVMIDMEGTSSLELQVQKQGSAVYLMNDSGRTIDHYSWGADIDRVKIPVMAG